MFTQREGGSIWLLHLLEFPRIHHELLPAKGRIYFPHLFPTSPDSFRVGRPASLWPQALACAAASTGSLMMGAAIGWSGPAIPLMRNDTLEAGDRFLLGENNHDDLLARMGVGKRCGIRVQTIKKYLSEELRKSPTVRRFPVSDQDASMIGSFMPLGALFGGI